MSLVRDVTTVGSATLVSRLLGFARDVVIAAILGAGALADAFFIALQIPNLFRRLLAEGAINAAFVPLWLARRQEQGDRAARRFGEAVLGTLGTILALVAVLCVLFAPAIVSLLAPGFTAADERYLFAVYFFRLAAPYIAIAGVVAVIAAILNAAGKIGAAAYGPVVYNVGMILAALGVAMFGLANAPVGASVIAASIFVAGLLQLLLLGTAMIRLPDPPLAPQLSLSPDIRRFFVLMLPGVLAAGIPQLALMAGTIVASPSPASVSWLYYAYRLYELPLGLVSFAIAAVMTPAIATHVRSGDRAATAAAQSFAIQIAVGVTLPAAAGLALLAGPIVTVLFERGAFGTADTAAVAGAVTAIALGIPGHAIEKVLASVSFAREDTRTPMLTALAGLATTAVGAVLAFPGLGHIGVAFAVAGCGWVSAMLLGIALARRKWLHVEAGFWRRLTGIVAATIVMSAAVLGMRAFLTAYAGSSETWLRAFTILTILIVCGVASYAAVLRVLGIVRIEDVTGQDQPQG